MAAVQKKLNAQEKIQREAASVRAEAEEKKSNEEKKRAFATYTVLKDRYTTQKATWDTLLAAEENGDMTNAQW